MTDVPGKGTANWYSSGRLLELCVLAAGERDDASRGVRRCAGAAYRFPGAYQVLTAGPQIELRKGIIFRPEIRYDYNSQSTPFDGKNGLFTASSDVILRW